MKRAILACLVAATVAIPGFAHAAGPKTFSGTILVGDPVTSVTGGVSETGRTLNPTGSGPDCVSAQPTDGVDGLFFDVSDYAGQAAVLADVNDSAGVNDLDVWFYDATCSVIGSYAAMATDPAPGVGETGVVPDNAAYAVVDLFAGANASFTLTVGAPS